MDMFWDRATLLWNIDGIIRASKNEEKKRQSSQIGLFESGMWGEDFDDRYSLIEAKPLSFEQKLFWERDVLWYMVTGHPLDNLRMYCQRRSRSTQMLKIPLSELQEEFKKDEKAFKDKLQKQQLSVVGIIVDLRKIITKTGKNMMFLYCEGFDYDFEVAIFDRDYDEHKDKVDIGKVVIIEGNLDINFDYRRKSIRARNIVAANLTQVREQARDMWLLDDKKRTVLINEEGETSPQSSPWGEEVATEKLDGTSLSSKERESGSEVSSNELEEKITENKLEKAEKNIEPKMVKYTVNIPAWCKLEQIHKLKEFLSWQTPGIIATYILLWGKEIDTKFSLESIDGLQKWEEDNLK
jgi:DNA polymerase-3 subunit alpha